MTSSYLFSRVRYLTPAVNWSVRFANFGPAWVPVSVRCLPLRLLAKIVRLHFLA